MAFLLGLYTYFKIDILSSDVPLPVRTTGGWPSLRAGASATKAGQGCGRHAGAVTDLETPSVDLTDIA